MKKQLLKKMFALMLVVFVSLSSIPAEAIAQEIGDISAGGEIVSEAVTPEDTDKTLGGDDLPEDSSDTETVPADDNVPAEEEEAVEESDEPLEDDTEDSKNASGGAAAVASDAGNAADPDAGGSSEEETDAAKAPSAMLRAPVNRAYTPESEVVEKWVIDDTGDYRWFSMPARDLTEVDSENYIVTYQVETERTDQFFLYGLGISTVYMNRDYYSGDQATVVIRDSSGNELLNYTFQKQEYTRTPDEFVLRKGEVYYITFYISGDHTAYQNWLNGQWASDPTHYNGGSGIYPGFISHHIYRNGRCINCYDEYPDDQYATIHYFLSRGDSGRPDFTYVATEDNKTERIVARAKITGSNGYSEVTTTDHLNGSYPSYGTDEYPMSFHDIDSPEYWDVAVWTDSGSYFPMTFRMSLDPETYSLQAEVISGKGSVEIGYLPIGNSGLEYPYSLDFSNDYGKYFFQYNEETEQLELGFTGIDDDGTRYGGMYPRENYETGYIYKPLSFEHYKWEYDDTEGAAGNMLTARVWDPETEQYMYVEAPNNYIPYVLCVILQKRPEVPAPVIEEFDLEMTDITDETATVTVTGRLDRALIVAEETEEPYYRSIEEQIMLSSGTGRAVIGADEVSEDGSFTITLEGASLDSSIVLTTRDYSGKKNYEAIGVPMLRMPVKKIWTDSEGNTGDAITAKHKDDTVVVEVYADGVETGRSIELVSTSDTPWEDVITGLPEYTHYERGSDPQKITYKAKEKEIKGYSTEYGEENSSKYLMIGEKVTEKTFSGKYILLSETAQMALSVKDGNVVVVPFDPDDEYQKWSTEEVTFDYAFIWRGPGDPIGQYKGAVVKNDKTGQYLGITTAGPVLYDGTDVFENPGLAMYVRSRYSDFGLIRTVTLYNSSANRFTSYRDLPDLSNYVPEDWDMDKAIVFDPGSVYPGGMNFSRLVAPPWPFLALKWFDAKMSSAMFTSLGSSVIADISIYGDSDGILYKVTNTPNSLTIEKRLEFETSGQEKAVKEESFYVALFTDADRTKRAEGIDVQKISIVNGSSGKVMIEGVPGGTYYIGETDPDGTLITDGELSDGTAFVPVFDTYEIVIPENGTEGVTFSFRNVIKVPPKTEDIIVTKKLTDEETGKDVLLTGKYTVYVALFADEDHSMRTSEIKEIVIDGTSSGTAVFKDIEEGTYYVSETDADGIAIGAGAIGNTVGYVATYSDGEKIVITGEKESEEITFENVFREGPPEDPEDPPKTDDAGFSWFNTWVVSGLMLTAVILDLIKKRTHNKSH